MSDYKTEGDAVQALIELKGEDFKIYRQKWDKVNQFELETEFPMFLHIETSYKCNFHCPMCTQGIPQLKEKFGYSERMTTEKIVKILEEGKKYGCASVSFQGDNEPFLMKDVTKWFALAKEYGFQDIMVNTNGSIMTEKIAEEVINSGLTRLRFSLDAITEETYSKIRLGGNFNRTMANIDLFLKKKKELNSPLPKVGVNFVKMTLNEHEMQEFRDYWNQRVDFVVIQEFMTPDTEGEYETLKGKTQKPVSDFKCNQPWQRLYIRGNGEVTPCCAMFSSYLKLGNLDSDSLYDLWNSKEAKELRKLHADGRYYENPICLKCSKSGGA
ncbi:MAG: radical SAM protein [Desulfamplus sp.]|nr:radical SAM protein [Desulfamplus sp.]